MDAEIKALGVIGENVKSQSLIRMPPGLMLSVSVEASVTELWTNKLCDCHINSHVSKHAEIPIVLLFHINNFTVTRISAHSSINR